MLSSEWTLTCDGCHRQVRAKVYIHSRSVTISPGTGEMRHGVTIVVPKDWKETQGTWEGDDTDRDRFYCPTAGCKPKNASTFVFHP